MKNKYAILIVAIIWILILGFIVTQHQSIKTSGKTILLKTEPVDPRDPFKGDYVNLQYDISFIPGTLSDKEKETLLQNQKIYAVLKPKDNYYVLDYFSSQKPTSKQVFIQGFVWGQANEQMRVHYNIESYYVPEGKGKEIEQSLGIDVFVEVTINPKGQALINQLYKGTEPYIFKD